MNRLAGTRHTAAPFRGLRLGLVLAAALVPGVLAIDAASEAAGARESPLAQRLDAALSLPALRGASVSVLVVRGDDGATLYAREPDTLRIPASNVKLFTALAVLDHFGPAHRFETRVLAPAPPDASGAVARLVVVGGGDPATNNEDWWRLASELRAKGLRQVRGDLVLDDSAFDAERWHPTWKGRSARAYHAPVGALTANYGAFAVRIQPGPRAGQAPRVELEPPVRYLGLDARLTPGRPGTRARYEVGRVPSEQGITVKVTGSAPTGGRSRTYYRSVLDPAMYAGSVLRMQLEAVGIEVGGQVRTGRAQPDDHELLAFEGRSLAEIVSLFMKFSNNAVAETLLKGLARDLEGTPGSFAGGVRQLRARLIALGVPAQGFRLVDGSGLSRENRASPRAFVAALQAARSSFRVRPELLAALPIGGRDGTLEKRVSRSTDRVRAKTGLLDRVSALSGVAQGPSGEERLFSILVNGHTANDGAVMDAIDAMVRVLAEASSAPALAAR